VTTSTKAESGRAPDPTRSGCFFGGYYHIPKLIQFSSPHDPPLLRCHRDKDATKTSGLQTNLHARKNDWMESPRTTTKPTNSCPRGSTLPFGRARRERAENCENLERENAENGLETRGPERGLLRPALGASLRGALRGWLKRGSLSLSLSLIQPRCCSCCCSAEGPARTPGLRPPQGPNRVGNQTWPGLAVFLGIYLYPQEHFSNTFALSIATVP